MHTELHERNCNNKNFVQCANGHLHSLAFRIKAIHFILLKNKYSRMPDIETVVLSQSHVGLKSSQYQADCLFRINSSTAI